MTERAPQHDRTTPALPFVMLDDEEGVAREGDHPARSSSARPADTGAPRKKPRGPAGSLPRVAVLSTFPPRRCGVAAFASDLVRELGHPGRVSRVAVVEENVVDEYDDEIVVKVEENRIETYAEAVDALNESDVEVVCVQHEYGLFGGDSGSFVLRFYRGLQVPIVTILHTVLANPSLRQRAVMDEICLRSARLVVMSRSAEDVLVREHPAAAGKVEVVPHGAPTVPSRVSAKAELGLAGRDVLLTFGLLSPGKGIEHVLEALPRIAEEHPEVTYVILGTTHPRVAARHGETYRRMLETLTRRLRMEDHVLFLDRFVEARELTTFLGATDIYLTPYLGLEQATSGTLAYALGAGRATVSSPYGYAREMLSGGRGRLVGVGDSLGIARVVCELLADPRLRAEIERGARRLGRTMRWPVVAREYARLFREVVAPAGGEVREVGLHAGTNADTAALFGEESPGSNGDAVFPESRSSSELEPEPVTDRIPSPGSLTLPLGGPARKPRRLPEVDLTHVRTLTDDTGIVQHAIWNVPRRRDGYCLDDNARALILCTRLASTASWAEIDVPTLSSRYLAFLHHAFDTRHGRFRNFLSYQRAWTEIVGSEDSHGRALWALGSVIERATDPGHRELALDLFARAMPATHAFTSPRAWAYTLLGLEARSETLAGLAEAEALQIELADRLMRAFGRHQSSEWPWFEDRLAYANARLPQALLVSGRALGDDVMIAAGLRALEWLCATQEALCGKFSPVGTNGFYVRGDVRAEFDQQPVEASGLIAACLTAYRIAGDEVWRERADRAFDWFLGANHLGQWLFDPRSGGCRDGLHEDRSNENQGAESTLSFQLAVLDMHALEPRPRARSRKSLEIENHHTTASYA